MRRVRSLAFVVHSQAMMLAAEVPYFLLPATDLRDAMARHSAGSLLAEYPTDGLKRQHHIAASFEDCMTTL